MTIKNSFQIWPATLVLIMLTACSSGGNGAPDNTATTAGADTSGQSSGNSDSGAAIGETDSGSTTSNNNSTDTAGDNSSSNTGSESTGSTSGSGSESGSGESSSANNNTPEAPDVTSPYYSGGGGPINYLAAKPQKSQRSAPIQPVAPFGAIPANAPPLPEVVSTPPDIDTQTNRPPYFENLDDVWVDAGQTMELRIIPRDLDGDIPGLFTGPLPDGAQFRDNFDGTKTIRWRPLEPDVGTLEIMVTAVDAQAPLYRTSRTVRIRIKLPSDLSTIENFPPAINEIKQHKTRAGDTINMFVKATDPNGYVPTLKLLNPPADYTFEVLPSQPGVKVLRWQTRESDIGRQVLKFQAIDAKNTALTIEREVIIDLDTASSFIPPGIPLRQLAEPRNIFIGYASVLQFYNQIDGQLYADLAGREFNMMTTENSVKWGVVNPQPNQWKWDAYDAEMQLAFDKNMIVHGHPLIWHRQLPQWIQTLVPERREKVMLEFIAHVAGRYADQVAIWDVVNEAFEADGSYRNSVWFQAMGESYIDKAFTQARTYAQSSQLVYNDFDVAWEGPKADAMYNLAKSMLERNLPLNGVGFQMHIDAQFDKFESVIRNFQRFADLGLDIYITELDVAIRNGADEQQQAIVYSRVLELCLAQPACRAIQTWGFTDRYSWIKNDNPLLFNSEYQPKPAYFSLQNTLAN